MKLDVKTLFKIYEDNYNFLIKVMEDKELSFKVLNDALIYSCLQNTFNEVDIGFTLEKFKANIIKYEKKLGTPIFFDHYKKPIIEEYDLLKVINDFNIILGIEKQFSMSAVEEILGNVLEKHINRKETGSYYTPSDTTKYISTYSIFIALLNNLPKSIQEKVPSNLSINEQSYLSILNSDVVLSDSINSFFESLNQDEKILINTKIDDLKIIDPTCGSGAFIITAFNFLFKMKTILGFTNNLEYTLLSIIKSLHGLDNSKEAIILMKMRLILKILSINSMVSGFEDIFTHNFIIADAFAGRDFVLNKTLGEGSFDWKKFGYKFDCVIGNPPYVESKKIETIPFATKRCGNLYAYTIERAVNICNDRGIVSFIVPLSFISTPRMNLARKYLENNSNSVYYASFADRPGCIFKGVHQRLTIFFAEKQENSNHCDIFTSSYNFWYNEERNKLFKNIKYIKNNNNDKNLNKFGNELDIKIFNKMIIKDNPIKNILINHGIFPIYLSSRIGFWTKSFTDKPKSNEFKILYCQNQMEQNLLNAFFNSSLFYFYWIIGSDCWHVSAKDYENISFDLSKLDENDKLEIYNLNTELLKDLEKNKKYIGTKQTEYEYKHKLSKHIIDKIDYKLSKIYNLTKIEMEYIKNFTLKYRMNDVIKYKGE